MKTISSILDWEPATLQPDLELSPSDISYFKFAPICSADVERVFSKYKWLLTDRQHRLNFETTKMQIFLNFNKSDDSQSEID